MEIRRHFFALDSAKPGRPRRSLNEDALTLPYDPLTDLPDLQSWRRANDNPAISLLDFVGFVGTVEGRVRRLRVAALPALVVRGGAGVRPLTADIPE